MNESVNKNEVRLDKYMFWKYAEIVKPCVKKYLCERFSNSLIIPEFNKIDFIIVDDEIPVEIQSTTVGLKGNKVIVQNSAFEDKIRRQIEDNIENYSKCWFFFDAEYYRYLNDVEKGSICLNLDWLAKYVKDDKLKIFTVRYDEEIKELKYEDLEFIKKLSSTCKVEYEKDERILYRNKIKIMRNVLKGYKFLQSEIDKFYDDFNKREMKKDLHLINFLIKESNDRAKLYGYVLHSFGQLKGINEFLNMNRDFDNKAKNDAQYLGIVEIYGISSNARTEFVDKFNISQYFPGYVRYKEFWDLCKAQTVQRDNRQWIQAFLTYHDKKQGRLDRWF